jgi:hypothetical protein
VLRMAEMINNCKLIRALVGGRGAVCPPLGITPQWLPRTGATGTIFLVDTICELSNLRPCVVVTDHPAALWQFDARGPDATLGRVGATRISPHGGLRHLRRSVIARRGWTEQDSTLAATLAPAVALRDVSDRFRS